MAKQMTQMVSGTEQTTSANHVYIRRVLRLGGQRLADYRIYVVGIDDHYTEEIFLECPDDDAAKETANELVDGHDVELWQHERLVAKFACKSK
jgi:hypothetical protein